MEKEEDRSIVVGITYPSVWEAREPGRIQEDLRKVRELDERIEILDVRYVEPDDLRTRRGADPAADLRAEAPPLTDEQVEAFSRLEVALAQDLPFDVTRVAPNLRWVQGMGAGVSQLASAGLDGVALTSAAGVNAVSISEFVIARILQFWKRLGEIDAAQAEHRWEPAYGREAAGSTVGIVGLGSIGRQVARRSRALGMEVLATRRSAVEGQTDPDVDELLPAARLHELLARSDAVVSAVPESPETVDLFDAEAFAAMRPGAFFCNVGRGSAVVEEALAAALRSGALGAAALDVTRQEPLPESSPLWDVPNLLVSPHSATSPDRFWENLYELFRENLRRYLAGEPLRNVVEPAVS